MTSWARQPLTLWSADWAVPRVHSVVKSDISTVLHGLGVFLFCVVWLLCFGFFFLLLSVTWLFEGFDDQTEAEITASIWACLLCLISFSVILRPFQSLGALAMWPPTFFFSRQTQWADLGDQDRCGTDFPTSAPPVYDFDLVGVRLRWLVSDEPGFGMTEEICTLASEPKLKGLLLILVYWFFELSYFQ